MSLDPADHVIDPSDHVAWAFPRWLELRWLSYGPGRTVKADLQGNGPVCQVETSPESLIVYTAYLVLTVHKILATDTRYKGAKKNCPKFERTV
jgi:hypothetical protein